MGEKVLLSSKSLHLAGFKRLKARFLGPFRVIEHIGKITYALDLRGRFKSVYNVLHVSQLRIHTPGGSSTDPPQPSQLEGNELFEVGALLKHRAGVILDST